MGPCGLHSPILPREYFSTALGDVVLMHGSNIIENRYVLSERAATTDASYLLAGSLVLYPIVCFLNSLLATSADRSTVWISSGQIQAPPYYCAIDASFVVSYPIRLCVACPTSQLDHHSDPWYLHLCGRTRVRPMCVSLSLYTHMCLSLNSASGGHCPQDRTPKIRLYSLGRAQERKLLRLSRHPLSNKM